GELIAAPGNPGIARLARSIPIDIADIDAVSVFVDREQIDLTVVGPELPLSLGIGDRFAAERRLLFGPTGAAARLESSKAFAKAFMARHRVPTARFRTCVSLDEALEERKFGAAGDQLVIEECLQGPEVSFFCISDGTRALPIGTAQDHKRMFDDDRGPNTGGMGAFAPSPLVDATLSARVMHDIIEPVIAGMAAEGYPFRGFLYAGLMLTAAGPKVIEFNVRFGDPEAQVVLPLIDEPLLPLLVGAATGHLCQREVAIGAERLVGVVLASRGYPESSESGQPIHGLEAAESMRGVSVYHAGT